MKKIYIALAVGCASWCCNTVMAAEYDDCLSRAINDSEIAMCNNSETARVMRRIQSRYKALSSNRYFTSWNDKTLSAAQNFQSLFNQWLEYRDRYCSLLGYTFDQGKGTVGMVQTSQCLLDVTNRFASDVEAVIAVYNKMAVN